jgi:hypothetical protein
MFDTMIARIKRVVVDEAYVDYTQGYAITNGEEVALAILAAMRDFPDQLGCHLPTGYKPGSHSAREVWQALIDAAIAEGA